MQLLTKTITTFQQNNVKLSRPFTAKKKKLTEK